MDTPVSSNNIDFEISVSPKKAKDEGQKAKKRKGDTSGQDRRKQSRETIELDIDKRPVSADRSLLIPGDEDDDDETSQSSKRPRPIRVSDFSQRLKELQAGNSLLLRSEYDYLEEISPSFGYDIAARKEQNRNKNRYINIMPFDENRVVLHDGPDYINASYIAGCERDKEYICSQGPLGIGERGAVPDTVTDFWRLVWQEGASVIVMLTQCRENGAVKCGQYFPTEQGSSSVYGDFTVTLQSENVQSFYRHKEFIVLKENQSRTVHHFLFLWPDHGTPDNLSYLLQFIHVVRKFAAAQVPSVVHCSAGVGRSGTFIALDIILKQLERSSLSDNVDIFGCVYKLRKQRVKMVQTESQYECIYKCVDLFIQQGLSSLCGAAGDQPDNVGRHVPLLRQ